LFPYEINEKPTSDKAELGTLLYSKKVDTKTDKTIPLDFISNYQSGTYKVVFSAFDEFKNPVADSTLFQINQSNNKIKLDKLFTVEQINKDPKRDGFIRLQISSALDSLHIQTTANYENSSFYDKNITLKNHQATITIPIQKEFEKSLKIGFESVFENQSFNEQLDVLLKFEEPTMAFEVESFRNKIEPGKSENWSFKLNATNTRSESEILASMYDSSLDQFTKAEWEALDFHEYKNNDANFRTHLGFDRTNTYIRNLNLESEPLEMALEETQLNWFGFNYNNSIYGDNTVFTKVSELKERVAGETIKGDPDAVLSVAPSARVDQVRFIKPITANAQEITETALVKTKLAGTVSGITIRGNTSINGNNNPLYIINGKIATYEEVNNVNPSDILSVDVLKESKATALYGIKGKNGAIIITTKKALEGLAQVKSRTNLSETAFFYPNLRTDAKGKISFNFTSSEALTAWKLRLLAHNKDAVSGYLEKTVVTQKELMVAPNFPRFFREKDSITITTKIANITKDPKVGIVVLQLFDAITMQPIDVKMSNLKSTQNFTIGAFGNTTASWKIVIPEGLQSVQYRVLAKAGNFSDGEENILPVLTNNILVTESIPLWVRENSKKEYTFENLRNNASTSLRNHQFTLEYTSNPAWLALQSLPYLMEYEHECAEQTFARFYANALAGKIINSNPKISTIFETWRKNGKLNAKLEENEELKSILLAETPWINDVKSEEEKKQQLATLFDLEKMKNAQEAAFDKLKQKQKASGGFPWYGGNEENEYITRHILAGLGHLEKLNTDDATNAKIDEISKSGIPFLDRKFLENHKQRTHNLKHGEKLIWMDPNSDLHYLYTRSFYLRTYPLSDTLKKATKIYVDSAKENWLSYSLYEKGMAALVLNRFGEPAAAKIIIESLKETASNNEDWGMYWIANKAGWYWYQAPIETQALLIEAFTEVSKDPKSVDAMKVWLLKNKQTKNWPTTKATTEAIYALLMQGTDWLSVKDNTIIKIGDEKILTKKLTANEKEAETGYLKLNWKANEITKEMATITIENKSKVPGYGGIYWQYFEDLDKIKSNLDTSLSVSKELYLKKNTDKGTVLQKITTNNPLKIGDLVTVRLIISTKEDMEFIHLKDMRASCFEPVDVLSNYQYKDNLGFYKSTKDAATHFFFDKINKGTYVLEYDIRVNNKGNFSNGISTIQSMYAPEFSSHTKGIKVQVTN
jgi:TonB-dependent SusC/RagA subfamily outer membrane receptor